MNSSEENHYMEKQTLIQHLTISVSNKNELNITILDLSNCNLTTLPECLGKLPLISLNLSKNHFKMIPVCLYNGLSLLEDLNLSENFLTQFDIVPDCLESLKSLNLSENKFINLPKWVLQMRCLNLQELDYSSNQSTSYKSCKYGKLLDSKLQKLKIMNACLLNVDFVFLKSFSLLQYLDISNPKLYYQNKFDDLDDLFIKPAWMKCMEVLILNNLALSIVPTGIVWTESLRELHLTHNSLSWLPDDIEYLINLQILDVSHNEIIALPKNFSQLTQLTTLKVNSNKIDSVPDLNQLTNLKILDFYDNYVDSFDFKVTQYEGIDLEYNILHTETLCDYKEYLERKKTLREKIMSDRFDFWKEPIKLADDSQESCISSESLYDEIDVKVNCCSNSDSEENWDEPEVIQNFKNEISVSDNEWLGESANESHFINRFDKVYVNDEDWLFCDVD